MRLFSVLSFAFMATLVLSIPNSASATVLCKFNVNPCPAEERYAVPSKFEAGLAPWADVEFTSGMFAVKCEESILKLKTTQDLGPGEPLLGEDTGLTFEGCKGACTSASAEGLPYTKLSFEYELLGVGTMIVAASTGNKVAVKFGCPFGVTCTYDSTAMEFEFLGGMPAEMPSWVSTPAFAKTAGPGSCPASLSFKAAYLMAVTKMWAKRE